MDRFHVPSVDVVASNALIDYFLSEDMFLPADAYPPSADMDDGDHASIPRDANVENAVKEALDAWGRITVKVDDVAPCDSDWMMPFGDASCASLGHVYMAVKASNRVREHLEIQRENEANVTLHLQKWVKHSPAGEFRCYTNGKRLAFAGQRYPVNAIGGDLKEIGRVLHEIWTREKMGEFICGFLQVDIWLHDDWKSLYILGVAKPKRDAVENAGVFTFEELVEGLEDDEPCVVVRAITDSKAIAPHANVANVGVPIDLHLLKDLIGNDEQKT